jgi:spoIIIJ-associated protein
LLRIEELRLSAMTAAEKVKRTGQPFRFNPMNSRERRVIHLALRDEKAVRSESAGSGPARQVVVYPAGMASLPEPPPGFPARRGGRGAGRSARR